MDGIRIRSRKLPLRVTSVEVTNDEIRIGAAEYGDPREVVHVYLNAEVLHDLLNKLPPPLVILPPVPEALTLAFPDIDLPDLEPPK